MIKTRNQYKLHSSSNYWKEFYLIFLFYVKIFIGALIFGSLFFFTYAGIKSGKIPLDLVAGVFSLVLAVISVIVAWSSANKAKSLLTSDSLKTSKLEEEIRRLHLIQLDISELSAEFQQKPRVGEKQGITIKRNNMDLELRIIGSLMRAASFGMILSILARLMFVDFLGELFSPLRKEDRQNKKAF